MLPGGDLSTRAPESQEGTSLQLQRLFNRIADNFSLFNARKCVMLGLNKYDRTLMWFLFGAQFVAT